MNHEVINLPYKQKPNAASLRHTVIHIADPLRQDVALLLDRSRISSSYFIFFTLHWFTTNLLARNKRMT